MDILNGESSEYQRFVIPPLFCVHYAREINEVFRCSIILDDMRRVLSI